MPTKKLSPPPPGVEDDQPDYYRWTEPPHVLLYIDNSNIFESAKKYSGHKKGYINGIQDVACRIDVGKLISRAVGNRGVLFGKLYGSEPPALDSVWEAIRRHKVLVETFHRSTYTQKEKQTDVSLATDATRDIIEQKDVAGPKRTVILFSGDRDLISIVSVANDYGYKVEIWSFDSAVNNVVKRQAARTPDRLKFFPIDKIFHEITFTMYVWGREIPRERSLITSISLSASQDKDQFLREFVNEAGNVFKLPMMGKYLENDKYIVLVPCVKEVVDTKSGDTFRNFDYYKHIQPFTHQLDEHYNKLGIKVKLQPWNEFLFSRHSIEAEDAIICENRFRALTSNDINRNRHIIKKVVEVEDDEDDEFFDCVEYLESDGDQGDGSGSDDFADLDGDFIPYVRKTPKPARMYSARCPHKFWCTLDKCPYQHSKEEKEFFKVQPDAKLRRLYKIKACFHLFCRYQDKSYLCGYAHSLGESRCLCCKQQGNGKHWIDQCPMNIKT